MTIDIHQGQTILTTGPDIKDADLVVILLHGRGANAQSMMPLAAALQVEGARFVIPQAGMNRWYPYTAFGPLEVNEPDLSSALSQVNSLVGEARENGFGDHQIALGGFSQGACLAAEYTARNARKYAGLFVFSGALIGPEDAPRDYPGSLEGMPVFIGGSDTDPWVSHGLLKDTATVFENLGGSVDFHTYPGMAHTVNQDEMDRVRSMLSHVIKITTR
jgi:predicted esterase